MVNVSSHRFYFTTILYNLSNNSKGMVFFGCRKYLDGLSLCHKWLLHRKDFLHRQDHRQSPMRKTVVL